VGAMAGRSEWKRALQNFQPSRESSLGPLHCRFLDQRDWCSAQTSATET